APGRRAVAAQLLRGRRLHRVELLEYDVAQRRPQVGVVLALRAGQSEAEQPRPVGPWRGAAVAVTPNRVVVAADDGLRASDEPRLPQLAAEHPSPRLDGCLYLADQCLPVGLRLVVRIDIAASSLPRPGCVGAGMVALFHVRARPRSR